MMNLDYMISMYMFLMGCFMFCFFYKHLLLTIISLEFIMIFMIFNMYNLILMIEINSYLIIIVLTVTVCEGALSLSLIVLMVRFYGNDYINSLVILKW